MTESTVAVGEAGLYVQESGAGDVLVFVHGFALDHRLWDAQTAYFQNNWHIIRYDLRGFGRSSRLTKQPYRHADDLIGLLDHFEIDSASVVGLSLGARIALDTALLYPDRVRSLTLVGAILEDYEWSSDTLDWRRQSWSAALSGDIRAAKRAWLSGALFTPALGNARAYDALMQMNDDFHGDHFVRENPELFLNPPPLRRLPEIVQPAQIIIGDRDMRDVQAIAKLMVDQLPHADINTMIGVGHLPNLENPGVFNYTLARFLERLD